MDTQTMDVFLPATHPTKAEFDADAVANVMLKDGDQAATTVFTELVRLRKLVHWEVSVLRDMIHRRFFQLKIESVRGAV